MHCGFSNLSNKRRLKFSEQINTTILTKVYLLGLYFLFKPLKVIMKVMGLARILNIGVLGRVSELLCWLSTRTEWSSLPYARSDLGFHYHKGLVDALEPCHRHMLSNLRYLEDLPHFGVFCERDLAHILPPRERLGSTLFSKRSLGKLSTWLFPP
ncbi:hypothetical protein LWI29_004271 [Acer saccharum]|uniref:Uncharacterized protein n=1 Tax=Acer saccharum TaxID=4024 RepID=A0AA39SJG2_ACESA|nr:hypothetical protein LWI29_004271 [Acer saccharum]